MVNYALISRVKMFLFMMVFVGADPECRLAVRFINEYAYQTIFVENMFLEATKEELAQFSTGIYGNLCS